MKLESFLEELHIDAFETAHDQDKGGLRLTSLTKTLLDRLDDAGFLTEGQTAYCKVEVGNAVAEVHGYCYDSEEDVLQVVYCIDANEDASLAGSLEVRSVSKDQVDRGFRRLANFIRLIRLGKLKDIEESQPAHELVDLVRDSVNARRSIEFHVLTTGTVSDKAAVFAAKDGFQRDVWDLVRLSRACRGSSDDKLTIDFEADFGETLPCLVTERSADGIQVLFTFIRGPVLAQIYGTYRSRLLERNVRSFLQFTGKVNKGIRDTVLNAPSRFLPYNNGLSATGSSAELKDSKDGLARLLSVQDFQIVNGGQTTASIATALRRDGADLANVVVAMKLTLVPKARVDELVPLISKYANTQNRIQEADFDANHPWHIELERLSRSTWTRPTSVAPRGTRWFYERSRGQYADELAAQGTAAGRKKHKVENPTGQKFTKTDLAKFRLTWEQRPQIVSRGAQKCFAQFMLNLTREKRPLPDLVEFRRTVALAILFKAAERLYGDLSFTGYRAQVVTFAVARLSHMVQSRLPYDEIWESQRIPDTLLNALKLLLTGVRDEIIDRRPPNTNISEWCKKDQCWNAILQRDFDFGIETEQSWSSGEDNSAPSGSEQKLINSVKAIPAEVWMATAKWAKETGSLFPAQRAISFSIGQIVSQGRDPTAKQAESGRKLLIRARELGFGHPMLSEGMLLVIKERAGIDPG